MKTSPYKSKEKRLSEDSIVKLINEELEETNNLINQMNKNEDKIFYLLEKIKEDGSNEK